MLLGRSVQRCFICPRGGFKILEDVSNLVNLSENLPKVRMSCSVAGAGAAEPAALSWHGAAVSPESWACFTGPASPAPITCITARCSGGCWEPVSVTWVWAAGAEEGGSWGLASLMTPKCRCVMMIRVLVKLDSTEMPVGKEVGFNWIIIAEERWYDIDVYSVLLLFSSIPVILWGLSYKFTRNVCLSWRVFPNLYSEPNT